MKKSILFILLAIMTFSCSNDDDNPEMVNIESSIIGKAVLFGTGDGPEDTTIPEQNLVITDQTAWNSLITQMNSVNPENNISAHFTETIIDFNEYTIIAVIDGVKGNGGHELDVDIIPNSDNITVKITKTAPEGNATTVITQPFHIEKITKSNLPILFE